MIMVFDSGECCDGMSVVFDSGECVVMKCHWSLTQNVL